MTFLSMFSYLKKNYVVTICCAVAVVCFGVYYVRNDQITRLAADLDDLTVRRSRILKNLKYASDIEVDLAEIEKMQIDASSRLFSPEDLATNQRYFYQAETATGVEMTSIQQTIKPIPTGKQNKQARKKAENSKFQEIVYDMNVQGSYFEVLSFMRALEGGKAFAVLDSFSIVGTKSLARNSKVSVRLSVSVLGRKL